MSRRAALRGVHKTGPLRVFYRVHALVNPAHTKN